MLRFLCALYEGCTYTQLGQAGGFEVGNLLTAYLEEDVKIKSPQPALHNRLALAYTHTFMPNLFVQWAAHLPDEVQSIIVNHTIPKRTLCLCDFLRDTCLLIRRVSFEECGNDAAYHTDSKLFKAFSDSVQMGLTRSDAIEVAALLPRHCDISMHICIECGNRLLKQYRI